MKTLLISRGLLLLYTLAILTLSLISLNHQALPDFSSWDKLQHAIAYIGFALLSAAASSRLRQYLILLALCAAFGILVEYLQGLTAYRSASLPDVFANLIGLGCGIALRECLKSRMQPLRFNTPPI